MPYCIWVTRAPSYAAAHQGVASDPLDAGTLGGLLDAFNARRHQQDGAYWLDHPTSV